MYSFHGLKSPLIDSASFTSRLWNNPLRYSSRSGATSFMITDLALEWLFSAIIHFNELEQGGQGRASFHLHCLLPRTFCFDDHLTAARRLHYGHEADNPQLEFSHARSIYLSTSLVIALTTPRSTHPLFQYTISFSLSTFYHPYLPFILCLIHGLTMTLS